MARYRDYDDNGERRPRRRSPSRRARYDEYDDYDRPRRSAPGRRDDGRRRPPASRRAPASRRTRSRKKQGMSPGLIIGLITNVGLLMVVGVLYLFFPATWQRIIHFGHEGPAALAHGADVIVLTHAVPWGTLSLDDGGAPAPTPTTMAQATVSPQPSTTPTSAATAQPSATPQPPNALKPAGATADGYAWYRLARGRHTLVYTAAPFATLRCQVSVPAASGDTCPLAQTQPTDGIHALGAARMVDAQATIEHLSADQQKALVDAIQAALASQPTPVQLYEHYLNASGQVVITYVTLQATLLYAVNTDPAHAIPLPTPTPSATPAATGAPSATAGATTGATASATPATTPTATATPAQPTTCLSLCDTPATPDTPTDAWNQLANLLPAWRYTPSHGQPIDAPAGQGSAATSAVVNIRWNGQWQAGMKDTDKATLLTSAVAAAASGLHMPSGWSAKSYPAANPADGYLVVAGPSSGASAQVLYRFGVLLAVNSLAYTTFPSLLHANLAERTLAAGIKTQ